MIGPTNAVKNRASMNHFFSWIEEIPGRVTTERLRFVRMS